MTPEVVTLTRRDIARDLLGGAIMLWFLENRVASVHLLAGSALKVLDGVGRTKGVRSLIFEEFLERRPKSKSEKRKMWDAIRMPENFIKHATTDPEHVLDFPPQWTERFMFDAIRLYFLIYGVLTPLMRLFGRRYLVFDSAPPAIFAEFNGLLNEPFLPEELLAFSRSENVSRGLDWFRSQAVTTD